MDKLTCPVCGTVLELSIGYTGCDWNTKAGEGSGFGYELTLNCNKVDCGRVFPLGHLKNESDFSEVIEKCKCTK